MNKNYLEFVPQGYSLMNCVYVWDVPKNINIQNFYYIIKPEVDYLGKRDFTIEFQSPFTYKDFTIG